MILAAAAQTGPEHLRRGRPHSEYFAWSFMKEAALIARLVDKGMRERALESCVHGHRRPGCGGLGDGIPGSKACVLHRKEVGGEGELWEEEKERRRLCVRVCSV